MLVGTLASLAPASMASASVWSNHPGSICNSTIGRYVNNFAYSFPSSGIMRVVSGNVGVTCPLVRRTLNSNGANIYVDVSHGGTQTTTCYAYSNRGGGYYLASAYGTWTGSGIGSIRLALTGAGKSDWTSDYSVQCVLPYGSYSGVVTGIHLDEQ